MVKVSFMGMPSRWVHYNHAPRCYGELRGKASLLGNSLNVPTSTAHIKAASTIVCSSKIMVSSFPFSEPPKRVDVKGHHQFSQLQQIRGSPMTLVDRGGA